MGVIFADAAEGLAAPRGPPPFDDPGAPRLQALAPAQKPAARRSGRLHAGHDGRPFLGPHRGGSGPPRGHHRAVRRGAGRGG